MRIFSGIQPTGRLHIGNYFGAIKNMVALQEKGSAIFSIVDLHAITVKYEPKEFQQKIKDTLLDFLACGIDAKKSIVFLQSQVKEHTELAWLLNAVTPIGELQRMTQFKDKSEKEEVVSAGLLNYPILMAADILLYETEAVPVGNDQKQHLEFTKNIIRRFNNQFGETFKDIELMIPDNKVGGRIMDLKNPTKKMSKSAPNGCIYITDTPDEIERKIKSAATDSIDSIGYDREKRPGISNLMSITASASVVNIEDLVVEEYIGQHSKFKTEYVIKSLIEELEPIRKKREELERDEKLIESILEDGQKRAQEIATKKIKQVKKAMGLI